MLCGDNPTVVGSTGRRAQEGFRGNSIERFWPFVKCIAVHPARIESTLTAVRKLRSDLVCSVLTISST